MGPDLIIIEDDEAFQVALQRASVAAGFEPHIFTNWFECEAELPNIDGRCAGALIDIVLPVGTPNGVAVGNMLHHRRPGLKLVFMSSAPELLTYVDGDLGAVTDKGVGARALVEMLAA
jgi:ActR/RegA family two-component response regulator